MRQTPARVPRTCRVDARFSLNSHEQRTPARHVDEAHTRSVRRCPRITRAASGQPAFLQRGTDAIATNHPRQRLRVAGWRVSANDRTQHASAPLMRLCRSATADGRAQFCRAAAQHAPRAPYRGATEARYAPQHARCPPCVDDAIMRPPFSRAWRMTRLIKCRRSTRRAKRVQPQHQTS